MEIEIGSVYEDTSRAASVVVGSGYTRFEVVAVRRRDVTVKREADGVMRTVPLTKFRLPRWVLFRGPLNG